MRLISYLAQNKGLEWGSKALECISVLVQAGKIKKIQKQGEECYQLTSPVLRDWLLAFEERNEDIVNEKTSLLGRKFFLSLFFFFVVYQDKNMPKLHLIATQQWVILQC